MSWPVACWRSPVSGKRGSRGRLRSGRTSLGPLRVPGDRAAAEVERAAIGRSGDLHDAGRFPLRPIANRRGQGRDVTPVRRRPLEDGHRPLDRRGIDERLVRKAITQADACQWAFEEGMRARAAQVIADVEAAGSFAIVDGPTSPREVTATDDSGCGPGCC